MSQALKLMFGTFTVLGGLLVAHGTMNLGWFEKKATQRTESASGAVVETVRETLTVAHLPVTCHLTCPVTSWVTRHSEGGAVFQSKRYTNFPSVIEDINAKNLDAAFILAPLAMKVARTGKRPVKIVHLGHRDGTTIIVRTDSPYQTFADLKGKKIAIPSRFSNQRILIQKLIEQFGMKDDDVTLVEYPPPEHPGVLKAGEVDAYIIGEPFAAKAQVDGFGRVLYFTKDVWPNFISCVLVVTQDLIDTKPALVQELVSGIRASGMWIDSGDERLMAGVMTAEQAAAGGLPANDDSNVVIPDGFGRTSRMQAALIAARKEHYNQDPELLKFVLSKPPDRVKYTNLNLVRAELEEIQHYAEKLGYFADRPVTKDDPFTFEDYCDPRFQLGDIRPMPLQAPVTQGAGK